MLWLNLLPFIVSLAYRIYLNRGQTSASPDEGHYLRYASNWRPGSTYQGLINGFLAKKKLEIPPTRYAFFAICALIVAIRRTPIPYRTVTWVASASGAIAAVIAFQVTHSLPAALLVASSPLSLLLGRQALQDTFTSLMVLAGVYAVYLGNAGLLAASVALMVASREALLLYLPAILIAWVFRTERWTAGPLAIGLGGFAAVLGFYALGGRKLVPIFNKLREKTDYVQRVQAGMPHRVLVDLVFVSPVTTSAAFIACLVAPWWLISFVGVALAVHAVVTPKNVRFLLAVDIVLRMMCAYLPGYWPWIALGVGSVADIYLYRAFGKSKDPVTYDLVLKSGMFVPPEVEVSLK